MGSTDISTHLLEEASNFIHDPEHLGVLPCEPREGGNYPKVDLAIWLRSCIKEVSVPIEGQVQGNIPEWITGDLLQNGPGKFFFGEDVFKHLFDGSALLQKYSIEKGRVFYQCRFLRTKSFQQNLKSNAIAVTEFGTNANRNNSYQKHLPTSEPTKKKVSKRFAFLRGGIDEVMSDNAMISVYPLGKNFFCFYESPFLQQIDPLTLNTLRRIDLNKKLGVLSHASHPHYDERGNMLTIGMRVGMRGPEYVVNKFDANIRKDKSEMPQEPFDAGSVETSISCRWAFEPGYMHSFAMTENYYILIEQPLCISVPGLVSGLMTSRALIDAMRWHGNKKTLFHVVHRESGKETKIKYKTDPFFFLHTINAYEDAGHIVVDISCYKNPNMLYCMNLEALQTAQSSPEYADLFRGRPQRFVLPLAQDKMKKGQNLVNLTYTKAKAVIDAKGAIILTPEIICNVGCETPTINYDACNGKKYRFFYAITSDVDDAESAGKVYKIDTLNGNVTSWCEENAYCAEPMFIPRPQSEGGDGSEDDGVIISSMIRGAPDVNYAGLVILDAKSLTEIGRAEFRLQGPVPKPLHGYFTGNNVSELRSKIENQTSSQAVTIAKGLK